MAMGIVAAARKHWFLVGLVLVISLARAAPWVGAKGGPLLPEITVKYGAVSTIFFCSGLTIKSEELRNALFNIKLHVIIQFFVLGFVPILMALIVRFMQLYDILDDNMRKGLMVVGCMPPPVSSAVILTKAAGGNEAGAIFNSAFGSFLGIFVTPMLLLAFVGVTTEMPLAHIFGSLTATVVLPLVVGQAVRLRSWERIAPLNIPFGTISSCTLLLIIYTTFCDTFLGETAVSMRSLAAVIVFLVGLQLAEMVLLYALCHRLLRLPPADTVCSLFCSTHKSLTLGMPMINIIFAGEAALSIVAVPLLVYHPSQILLGGLLVGVVKGWMERAQRERERSRPLLPTAGPGSPDGERSPGRSSHFRRRSSSPKDDWAIDDGRAPTITL